MQCVMIKFTGTTFNNDKAMIKLCKKIEKNVLNLAASEVSNIGQFLIISRPFHGLRMVKNRISLPIIKNQSERDIFRYNSIISLVKTKKKINSYLARSTEDFTLVLNGKKNYRKNLWLFPNVKTVLNRRIFFLTLS